MDLLLTTTSGMNISLNTAIPGAKGESISNVSLNNNGDLTVSLTNGTIINAGHIGVIADATEAKNIAVDASSTATAQANIATSEANLAGSYKDSALLSKNLAKSYADSILYDIDGGNSTLGTQIILDGGGSVENG